MNKDKILSEIDKVNDLLSLVDIEVDVHYDVDGNPDGMELIDLQGVCFNGPEEPLSNAKEVMERCQHFFDETFLNGEICCNCDHDFETYAEAEEEARRTGYIEEADTIHELRKYYI